MKYETVKAFRDEFFLPGKIIYQLNSEFNSLQAVAKDLQAREEAGRSRSISKLESKGVRAESARRRSADSAYEEAEKKISKEGVHIKYVIRTSRDLMQKHESISERIVSALGFPTDHASSIVDLRDYLKI